MCTCVGWARAFLPANYVPQNAFSYKFLPILRISISKVSSYVVVSKLGNYTLKGSRGLSKRQARIRAVEVGNVTISESLQSNSNLLASY